MSFFHTIRHPSGHASFRTLLSSLSRPHQHVTSCFCSNQLRWTFLSSPRHYCPLCPSQWSWEHFFQCSAVSPLLSSRHLSLSDFRAKISLSSWKLVFSDIGHVLIVWSFVLNRNPTNVLNYDVDVFRTLMRSCQSAWVSSWSIRMLFALRPLWVGEHLLGYFLGPETSDACTRVDIINSGPGPFKKTGTRWWPKRIAPSPNLRCL
jgi:hypothetical protein